MQAIEYFVRQIDLLYGHYLDCTIGFDRARELVFQGQQEIRRHHPLIDVDASKLVVGYGGVPGELGHVPQHTTTQGEFKLRNSPGGENYIRASQNLIVLIYAYWDSGYRAKIAQALGIATNELTVPIMGDLRLLRNDLAHNSGYVQAENAVKLEVLNSFKEGDLISLDQDGVFGMVQQVTAALANIPTRYGK